MADAEGGCRRRIHERLAVRAGGDFHVSKRNAEIRAEHAAHDSAADEEVTTTTGDGHSRRPRVLDRGAACDQPRLARGGLIKRHAQKVNAARRRDPAAAVVGTIVIPCHGLRRRPPAPRDLARRVLSGSLRRTGRAQ